MRCISVSGKAACMSCMHALKKDYTQDEEKPENLKHYYLSEVIYSSSISIDLFVNVFYYT